MLRKTRRLLGSIVKNEAEKIARKQIKTIFLKTREGKGREAENVKFQERKRKSSRKI